MQADIFTSLQTDDVRTFLQLSLLNMSILCVSWKFCDTALIAVISISKRLCLNKNLISVLMQMAAKL